MHHPFARLEMISGHAWLAWSALSGVLCALAFPPYSQTWLIWIALVPLLWVVLTAPRTGRAFWAGLVAGSVLFLIGLRPLVSAHLWSGWQELTDPEGLITRQHLVLNFLSVVVAVWCGLFWALFAAASHRLARGRAWRLMLVSPPLFILFAEALRAMLTWKYQWQFLGVTLVEWSWLRQLAAVGGVMLLSVLVVWVNAGLVAVFGRRAGRRQRLYRGLSVIAVLAAASGLGAWQVQTTRAELADARSLMAGAFQHHQDQYHWSDYTAVGVEHSYARFLTELFSDRSRGLDLLVLPESVTITSVSLDGSRSDKMPENLQVDRADWERTFFRLADLSERPPALVMGMTTVAGGEIYNSLVFWGALGLDQVYHKRELVPFSERQPWLFGVLGLAGQSHYAAGREVALAWVGNVAVGGFICQEVQTPWVIRAAVAKGAQLLVSGGNDGVFADPAVAEIHADFARFRAVESGRYIVRAMKTGVSAIIDPTGTDLVRSQDDRAMLLSAQVSQLTHRTAYARWGDRPLVVAALAILLIGLWTGRRRR